MTRTLIVFAVVVLCWAVAFALPGGVDPARALLMALVMVLLGVRRLPPQAV